MQFFGVLPLTGRQLMYGFIGFLLLFVVLQGLWEKGASFAAAMIAAAVMTSKRWSPGLAWKRWRIARARATTHRDRRRAAAAAVEADAAAQEARRALPELTRRASWYVCRRWKSDDPQFETGTGLTTLFEGEWATVRRLRKGKLVVTSGADQGKEIEIAKPRVTGGRSIISDLVVQDKAVSGTHFEVSARDDGYRLRDLNSRNGIFVGDLRIREVFLRPGTVFRIGHTNIQFQSTAGRRRDRAVEEGSLRHDARRVAGDARDLRAPREGRAERADVPDHRRDRHRQGDGRARAAQRVAAARTSRSSCSTAARSRAS